LPYNFITYSRRVRKDMNLCRRIWFVTSLVLLTTSIACRMAGASRATTTPQLLPATATIQPSLSATPTRLPAIATESPPLTTPMLEATPTIELPTPQGTPVSSWNAIPIMPGAIAGEAEDKRYRYTIQVSPQQVQEFYKVEMPKIGWYALVEGEGNPGSILMIFQKDKKTISITILSTGGLTTVILVGPHGED
jgi:hypothetical protein